MQQAGVVLQTIFTREVETWKQMDKMKRVLEKFFRFELEEEVLKAKLDKFFAVLGKLQEQSLATIDQVQSGQMSGAPLHPLLASRNARVEMTNVGEASSFSPSTVPTTTAETSSKKQPLFKKSEKAKVSGAGAAAAMSAMEAFSSNPGTTLNDEEGSVALKIDTSVDGVDTTPVITAESSRTVDSSPRKAVSGGSRAGAALTMRQPNIPVSMQIQKNKIADPQQQQKQKQLDVPQVHEEPAYSSSFLTAVESGLPTIHTSLDTQSSSDSHNIRVLELVQILA